MPNDRTIASVKTAHIAILSHFIGRLQAGVVFAPTGFELGQLGDLAGALNAAVAPAVWPNPPSAPFPLNDAQKVALFRLETGLGTEGEWLATMPTGLSSDQLNIYKQFYAFGNGGWPECQYWYANTPH